MSTTNILSSALDAITIDPGDGGSEGVLDRSVGDPKIFENVVHTRRSVRIFDGKPVDEALMNRFFELAMLAPSSSNLQPWEFHWVRSADKRGRLVEACLSQPAAKTAGELVVIVARTGTWRRNVEEIVKVLKASKDPIPKALFQYYRRLIPAALTIGPLGTMALFKWIFTRVTRYWQPTPQEPIGYGDLRVWAHKSVALASQNFMLTVRAHGLDSCPMEGFDSWRVRRILNLPSDAEICMILAVGRGLPNGIYGPRIRFDPKLFVFKH